MITNIEPLTNSGIKARRYMQHRLKLSTVNNWSRLESAGASAEPGILGMSGLRFISLRAMRRPTVFFLANSELVTGMTTGTAAAWFQANTTLSAVPSATAAGNVRIRNTVISDSRPSFHGMKASKATAGKWQSCMKPKCSMRKFGSVWFEKIRLLPRSLK